jgi:hypothetical protein
MDVDVDADVNVYVGANADAVTLDTTSFPGRVAACGVT